MEWRSVKEKPTMEGVYQCLVKSEGGGIGTRVYKTEISKIVSKEIREEFN